MKGRFVHDSNSPQGVKLVLHTESADEVFALDKFINGVRAPNTTLDTGEWELHFPTSTSESPEPSTIAFLLKQKFKTT